MMFYAFDVQCKCLYNTLQYMFISNTVIRVAQSHKVKNSFWKCVQAFMETKYYKAQLLLHHCSTNVGTMLPFPIVGGWHSPHHPLSNATVSFILSCQIFHYMTLHHTPSCIVQIYDDNIGPSSIQCSQRLKFLCKFASDVGTQGFPCMYTTVHTVQGNSLYVYWWTYQEIPYCRCTYTMHAQLP